MSITIDNIRSAADALAGQVLRTPSIGSRVLSDLCDTEIVLKLENMQITGSFKPRGAYMKLTSLSDDERTAGVVAASAGNHAQGVAYHAHRLGIPATVYMPEATPFTKIARTESLGAHVELCGKTLAEARQFAMEIVERKNKIFVHPYDDELVVTGQGTVGLEIAEDWDTFQTVLVPIGGGGLCSGCAMALRLLRPEVRILGVEPIGGASMKAALSAGEPVTLDRSESIADGLLPVRTGDLTFRHVRELVDDVVLVDEESIREAAAFLLVQLRLVVEFSGAATVAALISGQVDTTNRKTVAVVSGGNIDPSVLIGR